MDYVKGGKVKSSYELEENANNYLTKKEAK